MVARLRLALRRVRTGRGRGAPLDVQQIRGHIGVPEADPIVATERVQIGEDVALVIQQNGVKTLRIDEMRPQHGGAETPPTGAVVQVVIDGAVRGERLVIGERVLIGTQQAEDEGELEQFVPVHLLERQHRRTG